MPSFVTVDIDRVKPHLQKFLIYLSENRDYPLTFRRGHWINLFLARQLSNFNQLKLFSIIDRRSVQQYYSAKRSADTITINIRYNRVKDPRSYNYLSEQSKIIFRQELKNEFNLIFDRFVKKKMLQNYTRKQAVLIFMRAFEITEDDIQFESLYRHSSRMLEEIQV